MDRARLNMAESPTRKSQYANRVIVLCLLLLAITLAVYGQVVKHDFVSLDDDIYLTENYYVLAGLTTAGIVWAFSFTDSPYWHPLTWLSHMLDCQLYGLSPSMHHLTNVVLHLANTLLLFLVFYRMTGALWRSCFVAALFALHPLNVESVAWVSERKNLLSTFFWLLTMVFYVRYSKKPCLARYVLVVSIFALGLMAKPMLVTLPFVLLLLDYWPLGRFPFQQVDSDTRTEAAPATIPVFQKTISVNLVLEKVPLLILSVLSSFLTSLSVQRSGIVISTTLVPMKLRIANAIVSYARYIGKLIWPQDLAVFYPYPSTVPLWQSVGAGLLLAGISFLVIRAWRKLPYLCIGWLWYLGTLIPAIGLVQAGQWPAMADRFTYVPAIGLFVMLAWLIPHVLTKWRYRKTGLVLAAGALLAVLLLLTRAQLNRWSNTITLFEHTLKVTENNYLAHNNLGNALARQGKLKQAKDNYVKALRINPTFPRAHNNLANVLARQGKSQEAIAHYTKALEIKPNFPKAHNNLGNVLARQGKNQEAIVHYTKALQIKPDFAGAHNNLGNILQGQGKIDEAVFHFSRALELKPDFAEAHFNLGNALARQGNLDQAQRHFSRSLELKPTFAEAHNSLGVILARKGLLDEAIDQFREALRLKPDFRQARTNLEIATRERGKGVEDSGR
ncbi:MAG: tetratricopeptide repeat protein [Syntrophobacterales bacterium]|jgi:Tfp pilus assembly protein PilF